MSSLTVLEKRDLETYLGMSSGYVLDFSDRTFGESVLESVGVEIYSERYSADGFSKAKRLRCFWKVESDLLVGKLLGHLVDYSESISPADGEESERLRDRCKEIVARLLAGSPSLDPLKAQAKLLNANHLAEQIRRLEASVESDPALAIGTAKELIETCCKTILAERGKPVTGSPDIPALTKETLKELRLVPEGVQDSARGADVVRRILSNLGTIGNGLAELRGLYGTGHGKHGAATGLKVRHAKLAVGAASTLAIFLFETHKEKPH